MKKQIVVIIQPDECNGLQSVCVRVLSYGFHFQAEVCIIILASVAVVTTRAGEQSVGSALSQQAEITSPSL